MHTRDSTFLGWGSVRAWRLKEKGGASGGGGQQQHQMTSEPHWRAQHGSCGCRGRPRGTKWQRTLKRKRLSCYLTVLRQLEWGEGLKAKKKKKNILCGSLPNLLLFSWLPLSSTLLFLLLFPHPRKRKKKKLWNKKLKWNQPLLWSWNFWFLLSCAFAVYFSNLAWHLVNK